MVLLEPAGLGVYCSCLPQSAEYPTEEAAV